MKGELTDQDKLVQMGYKGVNLSEILHQERKI